MDPSAYAIIDTKADKVAVSRYASSQEALYNNLRQQVANKAENADLLELINRVADIENQPVLSVSNRNNTNVEANGALSFDNVAVNENNFGKITREPGFAVFSLVPGIYLVSFSIATTGDSSTGTGSAWTLNEESSAEVVPGSNTIVLPNSSNSNSIILKIPPGAGRVGFSLRCTTATTTTAANTSITFLGINVPSLLASTLAAL
jgi:hypothetical protein